MFTSNHGSQQRRKSNRSNCKRKRFPQQQHGFNVRSVTSTPTPPLHRPTRTPRPTLTTTTTMTTTTTTTPQMHTTGRHLSPSSNSSWLLRMVNALTICCLLLSINRNMMVVEAASILSDTNANHHQASHSVGQKSKKRVLKRGISHSKSAIINSAAVDPNNNNLNHVQDGLAYLSQASRKRSRHPTTSPAMTPTSHHHSTLPIYVHPEHQRESIPSVCGNNAELHSVVTKNSDTEIQAAPLLQTYRPLCVCDNGYFCSGTQCGFNNAPLHALTFGPLTCPDCRCSLSALLEQQHQLQQQQQKQLPMHAKKPVATLSANASSVMQGVVLVPTSVAGLSDMLTRTMLSTWVAHVPDTWDVKLFVGGCDTTTESRLPKTVLDLQGKPIDNDRVTLVCLNTNDLEYPPQRKVLKMFDVVSSLYAEKYQFFVKLDTDTYLNVESLAHFIRTRVTTTQKEQPMYLGNAATGREGENLGLMGNSYCLGMGYLLNQETLRKTNGHWDTCLKSVVSNHSDTEVGRCVVRFANASCTTADYYFRQLYYSFNDTSVVLRSLSKSQRMVMPFTNRPNNAEFHAICVHSVKAPLDMALFHQQVYFKLRPLKPYLTFEQFGLIKNVEQRLGLYNHFSYFYERSCVNNRVEQIRRYNYSLPECPPLVSKLPVPTTATIPNTPIIIGTPKSSEILGLRQQLLNQGFGEPKMFTRPSASDSIWKPILEAIVMALATPENMFLILHEDVVVSCKFQQNLIHVLRSARCGGYMLSQTSGVLYLGPQILPTSEAAREIIDSDKETEVVSAADRQCFNVWETSELECISGLYKREALVELALWINTHKTTEAPPISCAAAAHLADVGYITRGITTGLLLASNVVTQTGVFGDLESNTEGSSRACLEEYVY